MPSFEMWEEKMKAKCRNTSFRSFLKSVWSWQGSNFYKTNGDISIYPPSNRIGNLISPKRFEENIDELLQYGVNYDTTVSFFENYMRVFENVPLMSIRLLPPAENSDYSEMSWWGIKNCYLCIWACIDSENILYSFEVKEKCSNIFNSVMVWDNSENVYQSNSVIRSSNIFFSRFVVDSTHIYFSSNLIWCHDCMFCDGLENMSFCINNKKLGKYEYEIERDKILKYKEFFYPWFHKKVNTYGENLVSRNVTGSYITRSENVMNGYYSYNIIQGRNTILAWSKDGNKNMFNVIMSWAPNLDNCYNVINSWWGWNIYCSDTIAQWYSIYYSYLLQNCSFCLGCIGLKNKSYCILNTQYTKEEWEKKACEIFAAMEADGTLWDFFPASMNPFYFNDTMAYLIDSSFTKEEVEKEGYMWRDESIKVDIPEWLEVVKNSELGRFQWWISHSELDSESSTSSQSSQNQKKILKPVQDDEHTVWYIDPDILRKVIQDEHGNIYRIVPMEYDFLMKHALPLPEIHWLERMKMGFQIDMPDTLKKHLWYKI